MTGISKKKGISLTAQIAIATVIGMVAGIVAGPAIAPVKIFGDIFLRLIMGGVPLIVLFSVTLAVGQISPKAIGRLGIKVFSWFIAITVVSAMVGIFFGYLLQPGIGLGNIVLETKLQPTTETISSIILNFFSNNIVESLSKTNTIQVIVFGLLLGVGLSVWSESKDDQSIIFTFQKANDLLLSVIKIVMKLAPIGVGSLIAVVSGNMGLNVITLFVKYLGALLIACTVVMIIFILITAGIVKVNPWKLAKKLGNMTLVAATTTSSAITLPIKMSDSETKLGVSKRISNLVNPLGMALNSAGQAVFISIGSMMIMQYTGMDFSLAKLIQIVAVGTLGCLGNAAVPGGGLVVFMSLMPALGLPPEGVALIAGVDWFRGAITTIPNVDCDALVSLIIANGENEFNRDIFDGKITVEELAAKEMIL